MGKERRRNGITLITIEELAGIILADRLIMRAQAGLCTATLSRIRLRITDPAVKLGHAVCGKVLTCPGITDTDLRLANSNSEDDLIGMGGFVNELRIQNHHCQPGVGTENTS